RYSRLKICVTEVFALSAIFGAMDQAHAQSNGVAIVGGGVNTNLPAHAELNYFMFLERIQHPWTCFMTGTGGWVTNEGTVVGLGWNPETGPDVVRKASSPPLGYQIGIEIYPDLDSAYTASLQGFASFQPFSTVANAHAY